MPCENDRITREAMRRADREALREAVQGLAMVVAGRSFGADGTPMLTADEALAHLEAFKADVLELVDRLPTPDTAVPDRTEHKIAGDVVRAADGAWVPCSCGARMPFPFDADDKNGEPVTALVIHLQSLVAARSVVPDRADHECTCDWKHLLTGEGHEPGCPAIDARLATPDTAVPLDVERLRQRVEALRWPDKPDDDDLVDGWYKHNAAIDEVLALLATPPNTAEDGR